MRDGKQHELKKHQASMKKKWSINGKQHAKKTTKIINEKKTS
jgi:hypothetical protein